MTSTLREYADHAAQTSTVVWVDGTPWVSRNRVLRPLAMPHRVEAPRPESIRLAMRRAGAFLAQWAEGWDTEPSDWWYICCDRKDYDISLLRKMVRYDVRKGLRACEVRKVDGGWFAENGFPVYAAAFRHYGSAPLLTEEQFVAEFRRNAAYPGRETWGGFIAGKFVAWISCVTVDDAVMLSSSKCDPAYFKTRPNNALVYVLTRHYLRERGLEYVISGARNLLHDTNVQDFDQRMGYRQVYCRLRVALNPALRFVNALRLPRWARRAGLGGALRGPLDKLDVLAELVRISRTCAGALPRTKDSRKASASSHALENGAIEREVGADW